MEPGHLPLLLLLPFLLAASAFSSSSETTLFSLTHGDRIRLSHMSRAAASAVARLLEHPRALLITILLANNVVNVSYLVVSSILAARSTPGVGLAISAGSLLALILLGEILPKLFARKKRVEFARILGPGMLAFHRGITPLRQVLDRGIIAPLARLLRPGGGSGASGAARDAHVSVEELSSLLEISARRGEIDAEEQRLLGEVVELHAIRVREAMLPRQEMSWIHDAAKAPELLSVIEKSGRMQIPVFRDSQEGQVLGMVDARRYLAAREQGEAFSRSRARGGGGGGAGRAGVRSPRVTDFLTPALFIPDLARLDQCLEQFRKQRVHEALCVDEFGAIVGMIRIEDVLRELVAHPHAPAPPEGEMGPAGSAGAEERVEQAGPGQWLVPGRLGLRALTEFLAAPHILSTYQRVSTVAGAIIVKLGRVPTVGDSVTIGNVHLRVESMRGRSVERVHVSLVPEAGAAPASESTGDIT